MRGVLLAALLVGCAAQAPPVEEEPAAAETPEAVATPAATPAVEPIATPAADGDVPSIAALPDPAGIADSPKGLPNGAWAPELDLLDLASGSTYRLSEHVGPNATSNAKVAVVGFAASWCGRCKLSYPYLAKLQKEFGEDLHVVFVTTDSDEPAMQKEVAAVQAGGLQVPVLKPDAHTLRAWLGQKRNVPHFFIVNRAGEVLVQDRGFGKKVEKVLPGQLRYAINHPDWVDRSPKPRPSAG